MAGRSQKHLFIRSRAAVFARDFLFNPYFALMLASGAFLRFGPSPGAIAGAQSVSVLVAALYIVAGAVFLAALYGATRRKIVLHWENFTLPSRVNNFVDLMSIAKSSVVFVTGSLDSNFYAQPAVVAALQDLAEGVRITLYHEEELDRCSAQFIAELERRRADLRRIEPNRISHGAVVDGKHCKIEEFGVDDDAPTKHVDYFAFDERRARRALTDIQSFEVKTGKTC